MAPGFVCLTSDSGFGAITGTEIAQLHKSVARGEMPWLPHFLDSHVLTMRHRSQTAVPALGAVIMAALR